jgi:hypothetical protein
MKSYIIYQTTIQVGARNDIAVDSGECDRSTNTKSAYRSAEMCNADHQAFADAFAANKRSDNASTATRSVCGDHTTPSVNAI